MHVSVFLIEKRTNAKFKGEKKGWLVFILQWDLPLDELKETVPLG